MLDAVLHDVFHGNQPLLESTVVGRVLVCSEQLQLTPELVLVHGWRVKHVVVVVRHVTSDSNGRIEAIIDHGKR